LRVKEVVLNIKKDKQPASDETSLSQEMKRRSEFQNLSIDRLWTSQKADKIGGQKMILILLLTVPEAQSKPS